jgi:hypothetical protein
MATKTPPPESSGKAPTREPNHSQDIELLKVIVTREGQKVSAQWAIHPQMKKDLPPEEWTELSTLMLKVTGLVGTRFAEILDEAEPDKPGIA